MDNYRYYQARPPGGAGPGLDAASPQSIGNRTMKQANPHLAARRARKADLLPRAAALAAEGRTCQELRQECAESLNAPAGDGRSDGGVTRTVTTTMSRSGPQRRIVTTPRLRGATPATSGRQDPSGSQESGSSGGQSASLAGASRSECSAPCGRIARRCSVARWRVALRCSARWGEQRRGVAERRPSEKAERLAEVVCAK